MASNEQPIIIKKIEGEGGGGHHGGGWKVAYADFMTAMMAFFLLLWILAASDEEALRGLADYFTPSLSQAGGKGQGMLDGTIIAPNGDQGGSNTPDGNTRLPSFGQENPLAVFDSRLRDEATDVIVEYETKEDGTMEPKSMGEGEDEEDGSAAEQAAERQALEEQYQAEVKEREANMERLEEEIRRHIQERVDLEDLGENLRFDRTSEGLLVQIMDKEGRSMFARGSARVDSRTRDLIRIIGESIVDMQNAIVITGHTDAVPFVNNLGYSNWELSADRANATRRVLIDTGVSPARIKRISGLASTDPLNADDPEAAENRRIGVLLAYPAPLAPDMDAPNR
ncbi:chemotaxis MotB protein [Pseudooceanicola batsensis HTCC2597]|uniref:Chemotaxis MotB protein n=1 Tax=Pseudooceanicola batsensis (strain ATCC BAA-863 / DSM 15984 / KCTC 12145 / HTCC2597) TaxID=252305 RepID=A3U113_PSEBH|nr:flagellar motor protein MotB [Pseudooceanicola batsensis]EAQ01996.1 chemotaxis MotB protein [Pseudooceanicola batsensis HTCC2597]